MLGNVVENLSLIRSGSNVVVERRGTVFGKQVPRNTAGNLLKVASNYHGYAIYSRTIHKRIFAEILFFVWIKDGECARRGDRAVGKLVFQVRMGCRTSFRDLSRRRLNRFF